RYRLLETIREYASERLAASGDDQATRDAHAAVYLAFAEQRVPEPFLPDDGTALTDFAAEDANFQTALRWLAERGGGADFARLVAALGWYWVIRGQLYDRRTWFEQALVDREAIPSTVRARIAVIYSVNMFIHGEEALANHWAHEALLLARSL